MPDRKNEPTAGSRAAKALSVIASRKQKDQVAEKVKKAYRDLKGKMTELAGKENVDALERTPASVALRERVADEIDRKSPDGKEVLNLVSDLAHAVLDSA